MAMKRILALLLAVGMVVGAQSFRSRVDRPQTGAPGDVPGTSGELTLTCDVGLEAVCESVAEEVGVETTALAPATVGDRLAARGGDLPQGAWVTLEPWVDMGALQREAGGQQPVLGEPTLLARSPLVAAVWEDRAGALADHCGDLAWRCVGDVAAGSWADIGAEEGWGLVKPVRPEEAGTAEGVLVLGQLAVGFFGRQDLTRSDVEDTAFFTWFTGLEDASPTLPPGAASPVAAMVQFGAGALDIAAVVEAHAAPLLARSRARAATLQLRVIEPVATADLVVTTIGDDGDAGELAAQVAQLAPALLAEAGWRVDDEPLAPALAEVGVELPAGLPPEAELPPAGTLLALRQFAQEVRR